jgi:hypothetical protein
MRCNWTPEEMAYLRRWASSKDSHWLTAQLPKISGNTRSLSAVQQQMQKHALADQIPEGYIRAHWVRGGEPRGKLYETLVRHAQTAGVLRRQRTSVRQYYIIPEKWVEEFFNARNGGAHGFTAEEIRVQWWDTATVAMKLGKKSNALASELNKPKSWLGHAFNGKQPVRRWRDYATAGNKYWWHPDDVLRILPRWEAYKSTRPTDPRAHLLHNHAGSTINE